MKAEDVMTRAVVTIAPDATLREAIETSDGVRSIDDRVVCVEPVSGTVVDEPASGVQTVKR